MRILLSLLLCLLYTQADASPFRQTCPGRGALCQPQVVTTCSYTPPLDAQAAQFAYSFRLLRTAYSGGNIVTLRRSSDSTTKTFTLTVPNCTINQSDAFFDGSTYTIVTWYDQSGNGKGLTATNAPTITLNCQNSQPCVHLASGSSQWLSNNTGLSLAANTVAVVGYFDDVTASHVLTYLGDGNAGGPSQGMTMTFGSSSSVIKARRSWNTSGNQDASSGTNAINTWYRVIASYNANLSHLVVNGTAATDNTTNQTLQSGGWITIGANNPIGGGQTFMNGRIAEAIWFTPDLSITNANTVSSNQSSFWSIP